MKSERYWEAAHTAPLFSGILVAAMVHALGWPMPLGYAMAVVTALAVTGYYWPVFTLYPPRFVRGMLAIGVLLGGLWFWLETHVNYPHLGADNSALVVRLWLESEPQWRPWLWGLRVLGFIVLTPVTEELFFRGFMPRFIAGKRFYERSFRDPNRLCYFASAVAFAALHREWISALIFALALNAVLKRTGTIWACIVAHAIANLTLACWHLW